MILVLRSGGTDPQLLGRMVAGRPFAEHLPAQLGAVSAEAVTVVESGDAAGDAEGGRLTVDANVWLSTAALAALLARGDGAEVAVEAMDGEGVVARYVPAAAGGDAPALSVPARELDPEQGPVRVRGLLELARVERAVSYQRACALLRAGVWIRDPACVSIHGELVCGAGVEIDTGAVFDGPVVLGDGVKVGAHCLLAECEIGAGTEVRAFSMVEGARVGAGSFVGPYGRVRPGSDVGDRVQIGNFVEIKNSRIGSGSRINHLAFVGDATLGERVTIGAGTITCNHDGVRAQPTEIGTGAYVGSGCLLVAPLTVGADATVAAGSTVTKDAPAGVLTVARARQVTVEKWKRRDPTAP